MAWLVHAFDRPFHYLIDACTRLHASSPTWWQSCRSSIARRSLSVAGVASNGGISNTSRSLSVAAKGAAVAADAAVVSRRRDVLLVARLLEGRRKAPRWRRRERGCVIAAAARRGPVGRCRKGWNKRLVRVSPVD